MKKRKNLRWKLVDENGETVISGTRNTVVNMMYYRIEFKGIFSDTLIQNF